MPVVIGAKGASLPGVGSFAPYAYVDWLSTAQEAQLVQGGDAAYTPSRSIRPALVPAVEALVSGDWFYPPSKVNSAGPIIVAHRGSRMTAPENSMSAFSAAYAAGIKYIELDVQVIANGRAVVMHDTTIDRTCAPSTGNVSAQTEANWKALRLSSLLTAAPSLNSEAPPFFDEVLDWATGKDVVLVVEPKGATTADQLAAYFAMHAELRLRYFPASRVVFNSFTLSVITRIRVDGYRCFFNGSTPGNAEIDSAAAAGATGISWADSTGSNWTQARSDYAASKGLDRWASNVSRRQVRGLLTGLVDFVSSDDAIYLAEVSRSLTDPWGGRRFAPGMLPGDSATGDPDSSFRGTFSSSGWVIDSATPAAYRGALQGYACPVGGNPAQRAQTIRVQVVYTAVNSDTRWWGIGFCRGDDRNFNDGVQIRKGYFVNFRRNAQIDINFQPASGGGTLLLANTAGTNLTLGTIYTLEVSVVPLDANTNTITATIYAADGVTVIRTLSTTDAAISATQGPVQGGYFDIGSSGVNGYCVPGSLRITT